MTNDKQKFARGDEKLKRARRTRMDVLQFMGAILIMVCCMLFVVEKRGAVVDLGYDVTKLRKINQRLREDQIRLRSEKARLERPGRVFKKAVALGLRPVPADARYQIVFTGTQPVDIKQETGENLVARLNMEP